MNRVVEILTRILRDVRQMMEDCNYDPNECEDIMSCELGLEPDYIMDVLWD